MQPAVTPLGKWDLLLRFDDLRNQQEPYYARVIHCNYDWTKSDLQDLDFMTVYNEFPINNFEYSVDTHIPYVHYSFPLPPVKLPGNYVLLEMIQTLPHGCQIVFNLFAIEGFSHKEIAEQLGISEGTSKSQFARAKSLMQAKLLKESTYYERYGEAKI